LIKMPKALVSLISLCLAVRFLGGGQEVPAGTGSTPLKYEIWVELDDQAKILRGREEIVWKNTTSEAVSDMWFHLYWNAFKNEKSALFEESREESLLGIKTEKGGWGWIDLRRIVLADGTDLRPTLEFMTPDEPRHPEDQTVARVRFPAPLQPGEEAHLKIEFESKIPRPVLRTGYYRDSYFIAQWFPKPGVYQEGRGWNCHQYHLNSEFFADFATFIVHITVPARFVVGASGRQVRTVSSQDGKTITTTFVQDRIHDFAWTADPAFIRLERDFIADLEVTPEEYLEVAAKLGLPPESIRLPNIKMILLIRPEHRSQIERHFKALRAAIKYYGLWYGPYPYETITMVDPPFRTESGGMEYPTLFTAGTGIMTDRKVLNPEGVIIHEFGHGYWYGLVANNEFEEAWLDEGINTYSTGKVLAQAYGAGMFSPSVFGFPLAKIFNFPVYYDYELDRLGAILVAERDPITNPSWRFLSRTTYGLNVYQRASACLHTLERLLGENLMLRIMRMFQMRYRFRHPETGDFIAVVNEVSGRDMTWYFDEFFFSTLNFDYGIASFRTNKKKNLARGIFDRNGSKGEITEKDARKPRGEAADRESGEREERQDEMFLTRVVLRRFGEARIGGGFEIRLRVVFEDGTEDFKFWDGQSRWAKFVFERPSPAAVVEIDPERIWLIDSNLANNSRKTKPSRAGIFRLAAKAIFWVQNSLHFLSALS